jgi:hypothetical protein
MHETLDIPSKHKFLDRLSEPWRSRAIRLGFKLGFIKSMGYFKFQQYTPDGKEKVGKERFTCNIIPDVGATAIRDALAATWAGAGTNKQAYMDFGTGTSTPLVGDTDIEGQPTGTTPRIICTITSPGSYEIRFEAFIDGTWGTRSPDLDTLNNFGIFDDPADATGNMIAHALIVPGETITGSNTGKGTYGLLVR